MNKSILKKEFKKNDVQRLRNILTNKGDERTSQGIGYSKKEEIHKEGDIWEENNKTWIIKNGIKQNITKLDNIKKLAIFPVFCPSCNNPMNTNADKKIYKMHRKCLNCLAEFETELKRLNLWEEYEKKIHNEGIDNLINDYKDWIEAMINESNQSFITEQGDVEKWDNNINKERAEFNLEESIKYLQKLKKT
jgi:hypothetical protein